MQIRPATEADDDSIWAMLEPVFRAGETYCIPRDVSRDEALDYWSGAPHRVFVAEENGILLGTYFLTPNQKGGGAHVCNCGFVTATGTTGRGVARHLLSHALHAAKAAGYRAMQFNFVVATNTRAIAIWESHGFNTIGRLPGAFLHPREGYVDALVMYRAL
ncbi:GNAT family N-acetyltransferase [Defluviimonas sp. WL0050]|uniref:GNAT family N-acetyltransferase n=1 Tax=Albidovulum litorale TaxID=2984134 RepID=A0ABT2ZRH1_9RHOB|nr:N-acetyltransferase [Defluviimonas sp. WL0050]MCV2873739.1 GNAT family N-acetyltransferase [Defluviimonas sp. WL0050]